MMSMRRIQIASSRRRRSLRDYIFMRRVQADVLQARIDQISSTLVFKYVDKINIKI